MSENINPPSTTGLVLMSSASLLYNPSQSGFYFYNHINGAPLCTDFFYYSPRPANAMVVIKPAASLTAGCDLNPEFLTKST